MDGNRPPIDQLSRYKISKICYRKQHHKLFPQRKIRRAHIPLEVIRFDICGPIHLFSNWIKKSTSSPSLMILAGKYRCDFYRGSQRPYKHSIRLRLL